MCLLSLPGFEVSIFAHSGTLVVAKVLCVESKVRINSNWHPPGGI
jgi:hypothetical protein